jgi:tRNA(adenine34) deaminase
MAIDEACRRVGDWRLENTALYVTAEPCFMCAGAILQARIPQVIYGVREPKFGAVVSNATVFDIPSLNHHPEYTGGICEAEISAIMKDFFKRLRINS